MGTGLVLGFFLLLQTAPQVPQGPPIDENWSACRNPDADARIRGCTALILAGTDTPQAVAEAYHNRGNANRSKNLLDLALQDYANAIRLNPALDEAVANRGIVLVMMGRYAEAIPEFTRAIDHDARNAEAMFDRGVAYEA